MYRLHQTIKNIAARTPSTTPMIHSLLDSCGMNAANDKNDQLLDQHLLLIYQLHCYY
jgi:hypothetical protein